MFTGVKIETIAPDRFYMAWNFALPLPLPTPSSFPQSFYPWKKQVRHMKKNREGAPRGNF